MIGAWNAPYLTKQGMRNAYASGDYSMQQIAYAFGNHYSTVSRQFQMKERILLDCKT
jgi:putative transposase